jgi:hypothetical protein
MKSKQQLKPKSKPSPLDLGGGPKIELTSRNDWLDELE